MRTLFDNAFSPFARKVRMVLEHKGLAFEALDGLAPEGRRRLAAVNLRGEVPVLADDDVVVVNSSHIVAYLEHRYPDHAVYPASPATRATALAWERTADTLLDSIVHDVSDGGFGFPDGTIPPGLLDAARRDLGRIFDDLERTLASPPFLCGSLSIADLALFPHVTALRFLDLSFDGATHPRTLAWYKRLRAEPVCRADLDRTQRFLAATSGGLARPEKILWRGDRIEWLLANGGSDWFFGEIRHGRVAWPGEPL
jgi:glutathione S-transferase